MVCLSGIVAGASGRDLWLEADLIGTAKPPGERALHLREGEQGKAVEERPLQKERVTRFDLYADQVRKRDLLATGQEGQTPVDKLPPEPSACLVVMDRRDPPSSLDADPFNRMLTETGQEAVIAQRARLGQSGVEGKELNFQFLKALVPGQDPLSTLPNTLYKRRIEQRLELLLQNNPGRLQANHRLTVKVLFEGKPLAGAKVFAYRREAGAATGNGNVNVAVAAAVTSAQGLAEFKLEAVGAWLVEVTYVRAGAERKSNPNGAWESFEATYSLMAREAPTGPATVPAGKGQGGSEGK